MTKTNTHTNPSPITILLLLALSACQNTANDSQDEQLKAIKAQLDSIGKQVNIIASNKAAGRPAAPRRPTVGQLYQVPVSDSDSFRGGAHAKVTIVEATEYACPYCAKLAKINDELLESYSPDQLKIVSKSFVIHPETATYAALASCAAAKQGKFQEFDQSLWNHAWFGTGTLKFDKAVLAENALNEQAKALGLDMAQFKKDTGEKCKTQINSDRRSLSQLGVSGTPSIYVNGKYYGGQRTVEGLKSAINAELLKADQSIKGGASLQGYYASLIKNGKTKM